jgi:hypothetical protein
VVKMSFMVRKTIDFACDDSDCDVTAMVQYELNTEVKIEMQVSSLVTITKSSCKPLSSL